MEYLKLSGETVDLLSDKIGEVYERAGQSRRDTLRARLLLEETLMKYRARFGDEAELSYREYQIFSQHRFAIRLRTPSFDPFTLEENPMAFMIESVMNSFEGSVPTWRYRNLENEIVFTVRSRAKLNSLVKIAIAAVTAIALGIAARLAFPAELVRSFVEAYLDPLANAYAGIFCVTATLLSFFAISLGIVRVGDLSAIGAASGRIFRRFYTMSALLVLLLTLPLLPLVRFGDSGNLSIAAKSVYDILISFVPSNIVAPFLNFNSVHLMLIGAMFGFALLSMGQKGDTAVKLFSELDLASVYINGFFNRFISVYVAMKLFGMITTSDGTMLAQAGRLAAMVLIGDALIFLFYLFYTCLRCHIPVRTYCSKMISSFIICLSSANLGAAFPTTVNAVSDLGFFDDVSYIAMNLGSVIFRPACTLLYVFSTLFLSQYYGMEISLVWLVTAILLSLLLVAAVPNAPGVSVAIITLLFSELGFPAEAVGMMIAINAPLQFVTVAVDTWCLAAEAVCISYRTRKTAKAA